MLLHNPEVFADRPEMKDWTDAMLIDELRKEQAKGYVNTGLIPATVYKAAIEDYTFKSLHNKLRIEAEGDMINANVEKFAFRPMLTDPSVPGSVDCWPQKAIRDSTIIFLGDSGSLIYNLNMKTKYTVDGYLRGSEGKWTHVKSRWENLISVTGCGAGWADWITGLRIVLKKAIKDSNLELDPDDVKRLPPWYHVVCFDNLNSLGADTCEGETKRLSNKKPKERTTYRGFLEHPWLLSEIKDLMELLGQFKSCVYVRTAPASRWNMPQEVDEITNEIWQIAAKTKVTCIRGEWFWNSIVHFATPKSNHWHHAHARQEHRFLHYHWDRMLFRVISFSKACAIHPGILESICDLKAYEKLYKDIKRDEILDNPPQEGGSSSSGLTRDGNAPIDTKVEEVAPDIMPTSPTYSESFGASHGIVDTRKTRWTDFASEKEEAEEDANFDDLPDFEESLDSEDEALKNGLAMQEGLEKLDKVVETLMSNLQKTAHDHLQACKNDFQLRCEIPGPNAKKDAGRIVHQMNVAFGPDHKALEGFDEYKESLKAALVEEMASLLKKADLAKSAPMPSVLQKEKEKDRKAELARLAKATAKAKAVRGASLKPKPRPRSKSPNIPGAYGSRADLQGRILEQARVYTATVKKIVPTSSNCDDLGRAVMSCRQALDKRQPMKLACFDSDRIRKIDFDNEGQGTAYTDKGEAYERILKRLAEAKIDPVVLISEEWLPVGAGAWLVIGGNPEKDNPNDD